MSSTSATSSTPYAASDPPSPCPNCGTPLNLRRATSYDGFTLSATYDCPGCLACIHLDAPLP